MYKSNDVNVNSVERVTGSNGANNVDNGACVNYEHLLNEEIAKLEEANAKIKDLEKEIGEKYRAYTVLENKYNAECAKNDTLEYKLKQASEDIEALESVSSVVMLDEDNEILG